MLTAIVVVFVLAYADISLTHLGKGAATVSRN